MALSALPRAGLAPVAGGTSRRPELGVRGVGGPGPGLVPLLGVSRLTAVSAATEPRPDRHPVSGHDLPLVTPPPATPPVATPPPAATVGIAGDPVAVVARQPEATPPAAPEAAAPSSTSPPSVAADAPAGVVAPPAAPTSGLAVSDPAALEELAGRLYDRIRSRLRSELLVSRERAGRVTDLR